MDFYKIVEQSVRKGTTRVYPQFRSYASNDLMIRGKAFYAVWDEQDQLWSTDENKLGEMVDRDLEEYRKTMKTSDEVIVEWMRNYNCGTWSKYKKLLREAPDHYHVLNQKIMFANSKPTKKDYASFKLDYSLAPGPHPAWDELTNTWYGEEESQKFKWLIGSVIAGESKDIQKFIVFYGDPGSGKGSILKIIEMLFKGYCASFDAKALASNSDSFSLDFFEKDPLVAIQTDGDLSRIEDNTKLNTIVSHEKMRVNAKFKAPYEARANCVLFMASNHPVQITDNRAGILRRLIIVEPTGNRIDFQRYSELMNQVTFELGAIAQDCLNIYKRLGKSAYDNYRPTEMMERTNPFYNFVLDSVDELSKGVSLSRSYILYRTYCEESNYKTVMSKYRFRDELKTYFEEFDTQKRVDGQLVKNWYEGFRYSKIGLANDPGTSEKKEPWLKFDHTESIFDTEFADLPAQLDATETGADTVSRPLLSWGKCWTKLKEVDTHKLHWVKVPENLIVIDFDIRSEDGDKNFDACYAEAVKFPETYAELSRSGQGIHLLYFYDGDVTKLSRLYSDKVEVKVYTGKAALRRRLTKCNDISIAHINSGLPLKGEAKVINAKIVQTDKGLHTTIRKCLRKEVHSGTKPNIDFIFKILEEAYNSGTKYDVTDLRPAIKAFAANSTHHAQYCNHIVTQMHFKSDDDADESNAQYLWSDKIIFFDVEVFPNLFVIVWKAEGKDNKPVKMINPTPEAVLELTKYKLVGFNNRKYDNHILYARIMGYSEEALFNLSQRIISNSLSASFAEAYNLSYADIYDFSSKKQSLKKFEIKLGIHHQELGLPWDKPVPEDMWATVADYCVNDVLATEATWNALQEDFKARCMLSELSGLPVNHTTRQHSTRFIFGDNKHPQDTFIYRDLSKPVGDIHYNELVKEYGQRGAVFDDDHGIRPFHIFNDHGEPTFDIYKPGMNLPKGYSLLPYFPGYKYEVGKSSYRDVENVGEGGRVYAEPGMYRDVALLDIASMHPSSLEQEQCLGPYTRKFSQIKAARIFIKHHDYDSARKLFGGKLAKYLEDDKQADSLAQAMKIIINSTYGWTKATFDNPFRDPRNVDNIVAKRGALFMVNLQHAVQEKGFTVAHIKTDSIKIPNATPEIIDFVIRYGKEYGYNFEHEATYDRMCLVNDAVYIAKFSTVERCEELYGKDYVQSDPSICKDNKKHSGEWTATGTQFQVPYVFKTLFSHKPIGFSDLCETKTVSSALYLDMNEKLPEGEHDYHFVGKAGLFCPIKPGCDGGILLRDGNNGKYNAVTGTKKPDGTPYRWLEAEIVQKLGKEADIDRSYYNKLADDAVDTISKYGDFNQFVG